MATKAWTGDLDGMAKRRAVRVLTVYSKTLYFIDRGTQRGVVYDAMKRFEEMLDRQNKDKARRIEVDSSGLARGPAAGTGRRPRRYRRG